MCVHFDNLFLKLLIKKKDSHYLPSMLYFQSIKYYNREDKIDYTRNALDAYFTRRVNWHAH